jgi:hypothetical protein
VVGRWDALGVRSASLLTNVTRKKKALDANGRTKKKALAATGSTMAMVVAPLR